MVFKSNISKYKQKLIIFLSALFILLAINPPTEVYADWASGVATYINSTYSDTTAGTSEIQNGVSVSRTGYLCYMVNKESGAPTSQAKAFAAGSNWIPGSIWRVSSRHGNLSVSGWDGSAPWGQPWIPPASKGTTITSLEPQIKDWFRTKGSAFVEEYFPSNHSNFVADTEVLVVETIMNLQFSTAGAKANAEACRQEANRRLAYYDTEMLMQLAKKYGWPGALESYRRWRAEVKNGNLTNYDSLNYLITKVHDDIRDAIADQLMANGFGTDGGRNYLGSPVIGTVPNLLAYDQWNTTVFDSYLNKGAVHAEKIVYSEAGFTAYSGSGVMSDAEVQNYGVAMILIHCNDPAQTTCNEPLQPSPHDPPIESTGHTTIVKSYRTKDPTNTLIDDGTYSTSDLGTQIIIENEQEYQVVAWKTSTTTNTSISSISWESSVPSSVQQQGTTPTSVTLQPIETCLYVLLEKIESEPPEVEDYNYLMTQSTITRRVWM